MFNENLKKEIKKLAWEVEKIRATQAYLIKHPFVFKVGDEIGVFVVVDFDIFHTEWKYPQDISFYKKYYIRAKHTIMSMWEHEDVLIDLKKQDKKKK